MISLSGRSMRLSRQFMQVQRLHRSTPSVHRGFANSVIRRHDTSEKVNSGTWAASTTQITSENVNEKTRKDNRTVKKPSRLAALKKRSQDTNTSEPETKGAKATKGGDFIIRIEDTDQNRLVPDAEERIFSDLEWAGLTWSEGPDKGGPYAPYRQSERLDTYKKHTQTLIDNGCAYRCFCNQSVLEAQKRALHDAGKSTAYPGTCRSIPRSESDERAAKGESHVVRLDSGRFGTPKFKDAIYGPFQKKEPEEDFVLMKTDGFPTYHLANVVDDHLMKITHVIRGEEWLISTPKHLALYEAFGWEPPTFAHLGLLVSNDGSKLSKRNDSVNLSTYMNQKIFPMALQAWLANLGASFKRGVQTPRFLEDVAENLTYKFTRGGIKLNPQKLDFFQYEYRNLLFKTPLAEHTSREQDLIRDNLLIPLVDQVHAITASSESSASDHIPIQPRGTSLDWPSPLTPVPAIVASESSQQTYAFQVLAQETTRYSLAADIARLLPYFFWRPPPVIYRAALATEPIRRDLFDLVYDVINTPGGWELALERLLERVPSDQAPDLHSILRLIAIGSPHAVGKASRILFSVLGQEEWQARTSLARSLLEELDIGGQGLRQKWLDETAAMAPGANTTAA
ncbi:Glutamate--tRNA ligase mitochondrial [Fusarium torreyae]|uniref:Glutamate--tRNA ligase mitochondrial n=1 Tax=Fusarium torreyae TaxID=1237075 RepID=A0A9W8S1I2_9HYPO|nr:Glutamate--tRNA ligase mitochondrial [Fusarium torreyae]